MGGLDRGGLGLSGLLGRMLMLVFRIWGDAC